MVNTTRCFLMAGVIAAAGATTAMAGNPTWIGGGADQNWSTTANWANGTPWANAQTAEFGPGTYNGNTTNDITNANFGGIQVDSGAPAITVTDAAGMQFVTQVNAVTNNSASTLTLNTNFRPFLNVQNIAANGTGAIVVDTVTFRDDLRPSPFDGFNVSIQTTGPSSGDGNVVFNGLVNNASTGFLSGFIVNNTGGYTELADGANSFNGGVDIRAGTLLVSNGASGSATGTGAVTANGGGIAGIGSISGLVTLNGSTQITAGGALSANYGKFTNAVGTLSLNGGLNMNGKSGSTLNLYFSGGSNSTLNVGGTLSLSTADTLALGGDVGLGTYHVIDYSTLANASDLSSWTVSGPSGFSYSLVNNTGNNSIDLVVAATPEPAALGLLAAGGASVLLLCRRRSL